MHIKLQQLNHYWALADLKEAHQEGIPIFNCSSFATLISAMKDEMSAKYKNKIY